MPDITLPSTEAIRETEPEPTREAPQDTSSVSMQQAMGGTTESIKTGGKKIGGIILIVCALFTAFLGIKAAGNAPGNQEIIKDAVYVSDGKVLPENEGKVVIVNGTLDAPLPFVDEQTGIELDSIVAYRYVEKARVVLGSDDKEDT